MAASLLCSTLLFAQKNNRLSFALQAKPELTFHKNNYAEPGPGTHTKATPNLGIEGSVQLYLSKKIFLETGLGYIDRKLDTRVYLDQQVLAPPRQSWTQELVITKQVAFRTLQVPLNIGYDILAKKRWKAALNTGITGNYLLNTYYGFGGFTKYEGTYKKNYWQGYTVNIGAGTEYRIGKKIWFTGRASWSVINTMQEDAYLFSREKKVISLPHKMLGVSAGLRIACW